MNKLTVLAKNKETYFIQRLIEEVRDRDVVILNPWVDCPAHVEGTILVRTTGIHGDSQDLKCLQDAAGPVRIINPLSSLIPLRSKKTQYELLPKLGIPVLPWLDLKSASPEAIEGFCRLPEQEFLIKPHRGQGGWGIQVLSATELKNWHLISKDREYLLQPYMASAHEIRAFFIRNWIITLRRVKTRAPGANFKLGGNAEVVENNHELNQIIQTWQTKSGQLYGAVDALIINGRPQVLEINAVPGIEQLEAASGLNIMSRILSLLNL